MNERRVHRINSDVTILPAKDPTVCGFSINLDGVYICKLGAVPCVRLSECALEQSNRIADVFGNADNKTIEGYENVERTLKNKCYNE